jgi:hypothetical protein
MVPQHRGTPDEFAQAEVAERVVPGDLLPGRRERAVGAAGGEVVRLALPDRGGRCGQGFVRGEEQGRHRAEHEVSSRDGGHVATLDDPDDVLLTCL